MKEEIQARFVENIARVKNLVTIYRDHLSGTGRGRKSHSKTDVLRASVVLLHACVEDLLRSLAYWKLPLASNAVLDKIPLSSISPKDKFSLGALISHRGTTVDEVISASVNKYLEGTNYNNIDEISALLGSISIETSSVNGNFGILNEYILRRHQIVHRAERDEQGGRGNHKVKSISVASVEKWIEAVEIFGNRVLSQVS